VASSGPRSGQARTAITAAGTTAAAAEAQATGRQRRDGSRPSGNSWRPLVMVMAIPGRLVQVASQLERPTSGSPLAAASGAYCWLKLYTPSSRAATLISHPRGFRGFRLAIIAPRTATPIAVTIPMAWWLATSSAGPSPFRAASGTAATDSPTDSTPIDQATQRVRVLRITLLSPGLPSVWRCPASLGWVRPGIVTVRAGRRPSRDRRGPPGPPPGRCGPSS
jgi:hypothetical protein